MNAFDLVVTVALGSTLATVLLSKDVALAEGIVAFAVLIGLQFLIAWLSVRSQTVSGLVKAEPRLLVFQGKLLRGAMDSEQVVEAEILAAVRQQGIATLDAVEAVVLETDGTFAVVKRSDRQGTDAMQMFADMTTPLTTKGVDCDARKTFKMSGITSQAASGLFQSLFVIVGIRRIIHLAIEADVLLTARESTVIPWLFSGTADAARTLLSVVAGSLITVISIAISLTMVALVQASAQFTPQLLRQFIASRTNQIVLGVYTGTFIYALLILRTVRSGRSGVDIRSGAICNTLGCIGARLSWLLNLFHPPHVAVVTGRGDPRYSTAGPTRGG